MLKPDTLESIDMYWYHLSFIDGISKIVFS